VLSVERVTSAPRMGSTGTLERLSGVRLGRVGGRGRAPGGQLRLGLRPEQLAGRSQAGARCPRLSTGALPIPGSEEMSFYRGRPGRRWPHRWEGGSAIRPIESCAVPSRFPRGPTRSARLRRVSERRGDEKSARPTVIDVCRRFGMVVRLPSRRMTLHERGRPGGCCQRPPGGSAVPSQSHRSVANVGSSGIAHLGLRPIDCGPSGGKDRLAGIARYGTRPPRRLFARPVEAGEPSEPAPASSVGRRRSPRPSSRSGCSLTNRRRPKL
jgi:hypothetical protein